MYYWKNLIWNESFLVLFSHSLFSYFWWYSLLDILGFDEVQFIFCWIKDSRSLCITQGHKDIFLYFIFLWEFYTFISSVYDAFWVNICIWLEVGVQLHSLLSFVLSSCIGKTYFPIEWSWYLHQNEFTINVRFYF